MPDKPRLMCFVAKLVDCGRGNVERSRIVPLSTALLAHEAGWVVVGPDPADEEALAAWERAHAPDPFNQARRV